MVETPGTIIEGELFSVPFRTKYLTLTVATRHYLGLAEGISGKRSEQLFLPIL